MEKCRGEQGLRSIILMKISSFYLYLYLIILVSFVLFVFFLAALGIMCVLSFYLVRRCRRGMGLAAEV